MRVLIADADEDRAQSLAESCRACDHSVDWARHGASALEVALERLPEVIVCPIDLPVIDAGRLCQILRSNPRTRMASFVFLVKDDLDAPLSMDPRDLTVCAPWDEPQILAHLSAIAERNSRFGEIRPGSEMEGSLEQVALVDLLQLFQMNRKSGHVRVHQEGGDSPSVITIRAGQVIDASVPIPTGGAVVGEKALYRILSWSGGRFEFVPGSVSESGRIRRPMRALLMEGMRQVDELERRLPDLPPLDARLEVRLEHEKLPDNLHPLTREVLDAIELTPTVQAVLDGCTYPDYQVLQVLADLLRRGGAAIDKSMLTSPTERPDQGLFTSSQLRRLRDQVRNNGQGSGQTLKVAVLAARPELLREFHEAMRECPDYRSHPRLMREPERAAGLGPLGHIPLGDGCSLRVVGLPTTLDHAPLWPLVSYGMLGAIVLPDPVADEWLAGTAEACGLLAGSSELRAVHLLLPQGHEVSLSDVKSQLSSLDTGAVFSLPAAPNDERLPVLRNLFARLIA